VQELNRTGGRNRLRLRNAWQLQGRGYRVRGGAREGLHQRTVGSCAAQGKAENEGGGVADCKEQ